MYVEGTVMIKGDARRAFIAGLDVGGDILAVDGLGQDTRCGRLAHATRPAE